jgi:UDP:flavonoid glycosyltransferase YjiC (YdhE family)
MKRILIAWELGGGMGHVLRAAALARAFDDSGVETAVSLADLADSPHARWPSKCRIFQSARGSRLPRNLSAPATFGELLYRCGYDDGNQLSALVTAWAHLIEIIEPDVVLVDHAPTAQLAARIHGVAVARVGSGFFAPPQDSPTPCYRTWEPVNRERALKAEAVVLGNINAIFKVCGATQSDSLAAALLPDLELLLGEPETDCYQHLRRPGSASYLGYERSAEQGQLPTWPESTSPAVKRLAAYLKGDYQAIESVVAVLRAHHATVAYVWACNESTAHRWTSDHLRISRTPLDLVACARDCDAVICHAGAGTVPIFLQAGKPAFMLPYQAEQRINAMQIRALGAGAFLDPADAQTTFGSALREFLDDESKSAAARALASRFAGSEDAIQAAVRAIQQWRQ